MPSASKYIVDINKISKPGNIPTDGIFIGLGDTNRESFYAVRGTGNGGSVVIYDKVLYELSVDNITNQEPNAHAVTFTKTSSRTHGNSTIDELSVNPTTYNIAANTSTANTKTTTVTVNQALTDNGTETGNSVTVTITQKKDYPTAITLSITPNSTIPAEGGEITSALTNYTYSVKATYKSGNSNVDVTSNCTITANKSGVTATSKGTTASSETTAGTITFTASYTCNSVTKTSSVSVNIMQDLNKIESYATPTFTLSPGATTLPASGGSVTGSVSAVKQTRTWSSTSTNTVTLTEGAATNGYSVAWSAQTVSCESLGTTAKAETTLNTTYAKVTSTNGGARTKSYAVKQEKNEIVNTNYSASTYSASVSIGNGITAGASTATVTHSGSHKAYDLYTSGGYNNQHNVSDPSTITITSDNNNRFSLDGDTLSHATMAKNLVTDTVTIKCTNSTKTTASATTTFSVTNERWHTGDTASNYTSSISIGTGLTAAGGSATVTASAAHTNTFTWVYSSGSKTSGQTETVSDTADVTIDTATPSTRFAYPNSSGKLAHNTMGTSATTDSVTMRVRNHSNTATTSTATKSIVNKVESTAWNDITGTPTGSCTDIPASGGTVTATTTTPQSLAQKYTDTYTSTSTKTGSTSVSCTVAYSGGNTATAASLAKTIKARTKITNLTLRATGNGSKTKDATIAVYQQANSSARTWNDITTSPTGSCPTIPASGGTVTATTTTPQSLTQKYTDTYTSKATTSGTTSVSCTVAYSGGNTASASTLGTTEKAKTLIKNLTLRATGNGSKTKDATIAAYQAANTVTRTWNDITGTPTGSCTDIPASGGTVTATTTTPQSLTQKYTDTYTSTSTKTGSTSVSCTVAYSGGNTASASTLGTTIKNRTLIKNLTLRATGSGSKTKDATIAAYQQANSSAITWNDITGTPTGSCPTIPASGGTVTATTTTPQSLTQKFTRTYTSKSTSTGSTSVSCTVAFVGGNTASASNLAKTDKARTKITDLTIRATGSGSKTKDATIAVYQAANSHTDVWNKPTVNVSPTTLTVNSGDTSASFSGTPSQQSGTRTWTSTCASTIYNTSFTWAWSSNKEWATASSSSSACTVSFPANRDTASRSASITAKITGSGSKSGSTSATLTQKASSIAYGYLNFVDGTFVNNTQNMAGIGTSDGFLMCTNVSKSTDFTTNGPANPRESRTLHPYVYTSSDSTRYEVPLTNLTFIITRFPSNIVPFAYNNCYITVYFRQGSAYTTIGFSTNQPGVLAQTVNLSGFNNSSDINVELEISFA